MCAPAYREHLGRYHIEVLGLRTGFTIRKPRARPMLCNSSPHLARLTPGSTGSFTYPDAGVDYITDSEPCEQPLLDRMEGKVSQSPPASARVGSVLAARLHAARSSRRSCVRINLSEQR